VPIESICDWCRKDSRITCVFPKYNIKDKVETKDCQYYIELRFCILCKLGWKIVTNLDTGITEHFNGKIDADNPVIWDYADLSWIKE
jgi:hypothetical protein